MAGLTLATNGWKIEINWFQRWLNSPKTCKTSSLNCCVVVQMQIKYWTFFFGFCFSFFIHICDTRRRKFSRMFFVLFCYYNNFFFLFRFGFFFVSVRNSFTKRFYKVNVSTTKTKRRERNCNIFHLFEIRIATKREAKMNGTKQLKFVWANERRIKKIWPIEYGLYGQRNEGNEKKHAKRKWFHARIHNLLNPIFRIEIKTLLFYLLLSKKLI